jgi:lipoprotein signal peptidase
MRLRAAGRIGVVRRPDRSCDSASMTSRRYAPHIWPVLFILLVDADQLTKALAPSSWVTLDPGAGTWLPAMVGRAFKGASTGAAIDAIGCALLVAIATVVTRRVGNPLTRAGVTVALAGMTSNLLDRLGLSKVTQDVQGRVVVNWFNIGVGRFRLGNIADLCDMVGALLLLVAACLTANRALKGPEPAPSVAHIAPHMRDASFGVAVLEPALTSAFERKAS